MKTLLLALALFLFASTAHAQYYGGGQQLPAYNTGVYYWYAYYTPFGAYYLRGTDRAFLRASYQLPATTAAGCPSTDADCVPDAEEMRMNLSKVTAAPWQVETFPETDAELLKLGYETRDSTA